MSPVEAGALDGRRAPTSWKALLAVAILLIVFEPGRVPFFEPDEGRYAEIPREMLSRGDLVTPHLNGVLYFEKPPLLYWSVALSFRLFGENELAARVPGKLASVGLALLAYFFARRRYGERVAVFAALVTASSALVFALSRMVLIDPLLSLALAFAAFSFASFAEGGEKRSLYTLHISCAAAVMLKGLIGIVLPGGAIVLWALLAKRLRLLPKLFSPLPLLLFLALTVPWHAILALREPDFLSFYFVHEHFNRFAASSHRREGSPLFFVAVLIGGLLPFTVLLGRLRDAWPGRRLSALRGRKAETFLWVFAILVFAFFSISRSKLIPYLQPIWPALSVLLALGVERATVRGHSFRLERLLAMALFGLFFLAAIVATFGGLLHRFGLGSFGFAFLSVPLLGYLALSIGAKAGRVGHPPDASRTLVVAIATPWLALLLTGLVALPQIARTVTPWPVVSALLANLKPEDVLLQRGRYWQVVPFYTRRVTPVSALGWHELNFGRERTADQSLVPTEDDFFRLWNGATRVFVVLHRDRLRDLLDESRSRIPPRVLATAPFEKAVLVVNRP